MFYREEWGNIGRKRWPRTLLSFNGSFLLESHPLLDYKSTAGGAAGERAQWLKSSLYKQQTRMGVQIPRTHITQSRCGIPPVTPPLGRQRQGILRASWLVRPALLVKRWVQLRDHASVSEEESN